jgi:hypothetical protein
MTAKSVTTLEWKSSKLIEENLKILTKKEKTKNNVGKNKNNRQ